MINTIVTDVDGVLNTGQFLYDEWGKKFKVFGPHDNDGIKILRTAEVRVIAVSADRRGINITRRRCCDMGIELAHVSEADRFEVLVQRFPWDTTMFIGDGYHDAAVLSYFKFSVAPANAVPAAKRAAKWVTRSRGGEGVILEVALRITGPSMWDRLRGWHV